MRRLNSKKAGDVFTYEDDLEGSIAVYEERLKKATRKNHGVLQRRLNIIRAKDRCEHDEEEEVPSPPPAPGQPQPNKKSVKALREEHTAVLMEWSRVYGKNREQQEKLAERLREIKQLLGDTSAGLGLRV